jgi:hypothetical protein
VMLMQYLADYPALGMGWAISGAFPESFSSIVGTLFGLGSSAVGVSENLNPWISYNYYNTVY